MLFEVGKGLGVGMGEWRGGGSLQVFTYRKEVKRSIDRGFFGEWSLGRGSA